MFISLFTLFFLLKKSLKRSIEWVYIALARLSQGTRLTIEWMNQLQIQMTREKVDLVVEIPHWCPICAVSVLSPRRAGTGWHCCRPGPRVEVTQVMQHWYPHSDSSQLCSDHPMVNTSAVWAPCEEYPEGDTWHILSAAQWPVTSREPLIISRDCYWCHRD